MTTGSRILLVAMQDSVHAARWVSMIPGQDLELHFYPAVDGPVSSELRGVVLHRPVLPAYRGAAAELARAVGRLRYLGGTVVRASASALRSPRTAWRRAGDRLRRARGHRHGPWGLNPELRAVRAAREAPEVATSRRRSGPVPGGDRLGRRAAILASLVHDLRPDVVHSLEFQHAGYLVLEAMRLHRACWPSERFPRWIATNWGSDIYHFRHSAEHERRIRDLLGAIDYYSCECRRDVSLARELGYRGPVLPVLPNGGGFDLDELARHASGDRPSRRTVIMVKGYQTFAGRALTALRVLEKLSTELAPFEIVVFSATADVRRAVTALADAGTLRIRVLERTTHAEMLHWFGRARLYLGLGVSDGISTSALEALAMGAFPVQTDSSCCDEWFEDGVGGYLVPVDDPELIASRVRRGLRDDALVDAAARVNREMVSRRLDNRRLRSRYRALYETVLSGRAGE